MTELKKRLISLPILALPISEGKYTVDKKVGFVLLKEQTDTIGRPIK